MQASNTTLHRRDWLKLSSLGLLSGVTVPWFETVANAAIKRPRGKSCILLWMDGGTFPTTYLRSQTNRRIPIDFDIGSRDSDCRAVATTGTIDGRDGYHSFDVYRN